MVKNLVSALVMAGAVILCKGMASGKHTSQLAKTDYRILFLVIEQKAHQLQEQVAVVQEALPGLNLKLNHLLHHPTVKPICALRHHYQLKITVLSMVLNCSKTFN